MTKVATVRAVLRLLYMPSRQGTSRPTAYFCTRTSSSSREEAPAEEPDDASEYVRPTLPELPEELEKEREMVEMWNEDAPAGPEWGGPRGYEPTKHGDWARNGRVSDF